MSRNPVGWCVWTIAALAAAFMDRNPLLQALLLLVLINVWLPYRRAQHLHLRLGVSLALVPIVFSVALSRYGSHVLVTLPPLPIVGGRWTWDALLFGASSGAALLLTVAVFGVAQSTIRSADLLGLLPRPFYRAGTAIALSIAFAPKAVQSFRAIQESRRLRGARTGWRFAGTLLVPLLLTTLEQALQYGESLDARGYGTRRRSRYRPLRFTMADILVLVGALLALLLVAINGASPYDPYNRLAPPTPSTVAIAAVVFLATPALCAALATEAHVRDRA